MAKAVPSHLIQQLSGKIDRKREDIYLAQRLGKTVVSHYPRRKNPKKITQAQTAAFSSFADAVREAKRQLADPQLRLQWQALFDEQKNHPQAGQKQYRVLRNFVIASIQKAPENQ
ncbi:MAG: hypothetical protein IJ776_01330 [Paludibacteraceae bacterium]|nr:hypothetical protein [Paludibacteraceae bacterium]